MRILLTFFVIIFATTLKAQTTLQGGFQNNIYDNTFTRNNNVHDSSAPKKWFISSYAGISTGYSFFRGGSAGFVAAPVSLQLNRRLSNNVYAFAGVTVAPAYSNFNHSFLTTDLNKVNTFNSFYQPANFSMYSAATMGLMYINDSKTFSVSGSISVEQSSYPLYYNNQRNTTKRNNTAPSYR
ncbi:MAG TPA: hypothetical protein VNS50_12515 [Ginsengibacter sp.]|nr:hypothetical protein [Ginsengibacter sp.]